MRVCDVITKFIVSTGIHEVFMFPGGGNKFLIDGLASNQEIHPVSCHHEQAVAMSVVGYAKYKGMGYGMVTTGCGGTNTITGVLDAWQDSTACMFISGQCHSKQIIKSVDVPVRQIGIQEADIVTIVSSITKYAVMLEKPEDILYELEKAYYIAREGRPGPVWLDIPLEMQAAEVEEAKLRHFEKSEYSSEYISKLETDDIEEVYELLKNAKRPVVLGGQGIRLSGAVEEFETFVGHFDMPAVFSRMGKDSLLATSKYYLGAIGNHGNRTGNITLQNADVLLVLGSRLGINAVGYSYGLFAREAKVIVVDIDKNEHSKNTVHIEKFIQSDIQAFLQKMLEKEQTEHKEWMDICMELKENYPACPKEYYNDEEGVSMHALVREISKSLPEDASVCTDAGSAFYIGGQITELNNRKQRYITSGGQAEMGFALPAAVGVSLASGKKEAIVVTGDGSFMLNMQEMQTMAGYHLPIKVFVCNNNGYMGIRQMQGGLGQHLIGVDPEHGLGFPDFEKLAEGFRVKYYRITTVQELVEYLPEIHDYDGPVLCEVICWKDEPVAAAGTKAMPDGSRKQVLEDMVPYLSREEFKKVMHVKCVD